MKIDITERDIQRGKPRNAEGCPVWFGLHRALPDCVVYVDRCEIRIDDRLFDAPANVISFIEDFDSSKDPDEEWDAPEPFSFELPIEV